MNQQYIRTTSYSNTSARLTSPCPLQRFCLGRRRLMLFANDSNIRPGRVRYEYAVLVPIFMSYCISLRMWTPTSHARWPAMCRNAHLYTDTANPTGTHAPALHPHSQTPPPICCIGWLAIGPGLTTSNWDSERYDSFFAGPDGHLVGHDATIEQLRPKSPPNGVRVPR